MGIINEFKQFAVKGNVVDLAIGVIIGGAFGTIVKSLVDDVVMPPIGWLTGGVDFSDLYVNLKAATGAEVTAYESLDAAREAGEPVIAYGLFINNVIAFLIIAWVVFLLVKGMNNLQRKTEDEAAEAPVEPPKEQLLLEEIRDLLKGARIS